MTVLAMTANAATYTYEDPDTHVVWTYVINSDQTADGSTAITLGGGTAAKTAIAKETKLDAANILWKFTDNNINYTVTRLNSHAFNGCSGLTGTLTIPDTVTDLGGGQAFRYTGLTSVTSLGGATSLAWGCFCNTPLTGVFRLNKQVSILRNQYFQFANCPSLSAIFASGPDTGSTVFNVKQLANNSSGLKVLYVGPNVTMMYDGTSAVDKALSGVTGCKVFVPTSGGWLNFPAADGGENTDIIYYGSNTNLNLVVDEDAKTITATPKDAAARLKMLEVAPMLKEVLGFDIVIPAVEVYDWHDGKDLALEGRGFPQETLYTRLPERFRRAVPSAVWYHSQTSFDLNARFVTDSDEIVVRWEVKKGYRPDPPITLNGTLGVDVYSRENDGTWTHCRVGFPNLETGVGRLRVPWKRGAEGLVYLPMRTSPLSFSIGVKKGSRFSPGRPHRLAKPVVHYGTSIVHGSRADRPGVAFTAIMARELDVELVNLGFPGNGKMELALADILAEIDAALYIVDCDWNMDVNLQRERYEPFVRRLKERRPDTPILLCGGCTELAVPRPQEVFAKGIYDKLKAEDAAKWANLHFLSGVDQLPNNSDCTTDHCHPNVYGLMYMGPVYAKAVRGILGL